MPVDFLCEKCGNSSRGSLALLDGDGVEVDPRIKLDLCVIRVAGSPGTDTSRRIQATKNALPTVISLERTLFIKGISYPRLSTEKGSTTVCVDEYVGLQSSWSGWEH